MSKKSATKKTAQRAKPLQAKAVVVKSAPGKVLTVAECEKQNIPLTDPRHPFHRSPNGKPEAAKAAAAPAKPVATTKAPEPVKFGPGVKVRVLTDGKPSEQVFTILATEEGEPVPGKDWFAVNEEVLVHSSELIAA